MNENKNDNDNDPNTIIEVADTINRLKSDRHMIYTDARRPREHQENWARADITDIRVKKYFVEIVADESESIKRGKTITIRLTKADIESLKYLSKYIREYE